MSFIERICQALMIVNLYGTAPRAYSHETCVGNPVNDHVFLITGFIWQLQLCYVMTLVMTTKIFHKHDIWNVTTIGCVY